MANEEIKYMIMKTWSRDFRDYGNVSPTENVLIVNRPTEAATCRTPGCIACGICGDSTEPSPEAGDFAPSTPLRVDEVDNDNMGAGYDPGAMGSAETWFRELIGDK